MLHCYLLSAFPSAKDASLLLAEPKNHVWDRSFVAFRVDSERKWRVFLCQSTRRPSISDRNPSIDFSSFILIFQKRQNARTRCRLFFPSRTYLWSSVKTFQNGRVNFEVWLSKRSCQNSKCWLAGRTCFCHVCGQLVASDGTRFWNNSNSDVMLLPHPVKFRNYVNVFWEDCIPALNNKDCYKTSGNPGTAFASESCVCHAVVDPKFGIPQICAM